MWMGRPCFSDVSDITRAPTSSSFENNLSSEKRIMTTIIQGDLDYGGNLFNSVKRKIQEDSSDVNAAYKHYNNENDYSGTHLKLLLVAAMMTCGDILELGTDEHSAELWQDIIEMNERDNKKRMIVSAEADARKIKKQKTKTFDSYQLIEVPDCKGIRLTYLTFYKCFSYSW